MAKAKLVSLWSAPGSPGRTTLACSIAAELVESGKRVLLIDTDTQAPSIDVMLGLNDHPAGIAAAFRLVNQQRFDLEQLQRLSVVLELSGEVLTVMTGLSSSSRWPELNSDAMAGLIQTASEDFDFILLDLAPGIEAQLRAPHSMVERNEITRWSLQNSNLVIAVCGADPVSVARHLDAMSSLTDLQPVGEVLTLVNRLRSSVLGNSAKTQIAETLARLGQLEVAGFIPDDPAAADAATKASLPLALGKRSSQARLAISLFTKSRILGERNKLDKRLAKSVAKLG